MKTKRKGTWLMLGGLLFMAAALILACCNSLADRRAAVAAAEILQDMPSELFASTQTPVPVPESEDKQEIEVPDYLLDPGMEMPTVEINGGDFIGVVKIPSLDLELPVMSEWSDSKSKIAPCRYRGSTYQGDLIIAGHNYRSCFGSLKDVQLGGEVFFIDVDGNMFRYTVEELETIGGSDVEGMESGTWDLTLFTCTYGGQSRVTVRCTLASSE